MNLEALKAEFDADLASMTEAQLIDSLREAGFVIEEPWLDIVSEGDIALQSSDVFSISCADSNELALAA